MTLEVQKGDTTVRSEWTNSVRNAFRKQAGWAKLQKVRAGSDALDGTCVASSQPTLAAGVEGRSGSVKEWEFQR